MELLEMVPQVQLQLQAQLQVQLLQEHCQRAMWGPRVQQGG